MTELKKTYKMRLSSGYVIECPAPCGSEFESFSREVCCMKCRREISVSAQATAPARLNPESYSVHQRVMWARVRFTG